ncbi:elongin-C [Entomortierella parvispora]|uniref:Elongin-C n=1 Tax=Entomortierella parvispora TaxID=205924 RepID=A0A9P3LUV7_9FUNG|nr:elongin-C [Entomortierella parvispora]
MATQAASDDEYITLESSDKFIFVIHRDVATLSGTIKNMLSSGHFEESRSNFITLRDIKAVILEKVCRYWYYKAKHLNSVTEIPHFEIEPEYALETLMAADFLDT